MQFQTYIHDTMEFAIGSCMGDYSIFTNTYYMVDIVWKVRSIY